MKAIDVDGISVIVAQERGLGDGGTKLSFLVDEGDGTYSAVREWWSDPLVAKAIYDAPDETYLRWVVDEARRQTVKPSDRSSQKPRPIVTTTGR